LQKYSNGKIVKENSSKTDLSIRETNRVRGKYHVKQKHGD